MKQNKSLIDWNSRFSTQAEWTRPLRNFLFDQLGINKDSKVLEVGSGTGTILRETADYSHCIPFGLDNDFSRLDINRRIQPDQLITCADAYHLPFLPNTFDFVVMHYFLLWLQEPTRALKAIKTVLKPNGLVIALAEPDYLGRIEYPEEFETIGKLQTRSLIQQGADVVIGRSLPELLTKTGFVDVQFGISGFQNQINQFPKSWNSEWKIIEEDLNLLNKKLNLEKFKTLDLNSRKKGSRLSWVPTFYAFGKKT
jgi:ubiquinone/menaquinone biosynthesis C-methylase UbiE